MTPPARDTLDQTGAWVEKQVIYHSENTRLEYNGPPLSELDRVLVAFPPYDYLFDPRLDGWGARSFRKRGIANVCVFHANEDWHQYPDFFKAMDACRAYVGARTNISTYGFSMGGLGALLAARTLGATRVVAVSPQFSIDHSLAPFEKRFAQQRARMGPWLHNLHDEMDNAREYIVLFDPLQGLDRRQIGLLPNPTGFQPCLMHGANHLVLKAITQMDIQEVLFDLLTGRAEWQDMRAAYRANRRNGFRYLRKVGSIFCTPRTTRWRPGSLNMPRKTTWTDLYESS